MNDTANSSIRLVGKVALYMNESEHNITYGNIPTI